MVEGRQRQRRRVRIHAPLPLGYHRLTLHLGSASHDVFLIRPPRRAPAPGPPTPSSWGLFAPVYALRIAASRGKRDALRMLEILDPLWAKIRQANEDPAS